MQDNAEKSTMNASDSYTLYLILPPAYTLSLSSVSQKSVDHSVKIPYIFLKKENAKIQYLPFSSHSIQIDFQTMHINYVALWARNIKNRPTFVWVVMCKSYR